MNKRRILAVVLTLSLVLAMGMMFVAVDNTPAEAAAAITESQISELDFTVKADVQNGEPTTKSTIQFDLALKKADGDKNVKFAYYKSTASVIDVSQISSKQWIDITSKNTDGLSVTQIINYDTGSYNYFYFFKAERTVFSYQERTTYTYYYSTRGLESCVVSVTEQNSTTAQFYYFSKESDPQYVNYVADSHKGSVANYAIEGVSNTSFDQEIISYVSATYVSTLGDTVYDMVTDTPSVNSAITVTINNGEIYNGRVYEYAFGSFVDGVFVPDGEYNSMQGSTLVIDRQLMGEEDTLDTNICFRAYTATGHLIGDEELGTAVYGDQTKTYDSHTENILRIKWSVASPTIGVTQYFTDQTTQTLKEYQIGNWANNDVTYVIELANPAFEQDVDFYWYDKSISIVGGNVDFAESTGGHGGKIGVFRKDSGKYINSDNLEVDNLSWQISSTTETLHFAAKSGDVLFVFPINCKTYIDKKTPLLSVTARDYVGNEFDEADSGNIFARDNLTFTLTNNETCESSASAKYQYYVANGPDVTVSQIKEEDWQTINGTNIEGSGKLYTVTVSASGKNDYFDGTYFFRIVSGAGVKSNISKIDFSIDSSDYFFEMDENDFTFITTDKGWAYEQGHKVEEGIKVFFTVKQKGIYSFFYNISSRGVEKQLEYGVPEERIDPETGEPAYVYTCWINDESVKDGQFNFYARNRAGYQSAVYTLSNDNLISIDTRPANVTIEGTIVGASSPIAKEGTWVNGQVDIRIKDNSVSDVDDINVSDYEVYLVEGVSEMLMTPEANNDYVLTNLTETKTYTFKFVTGAGVVSERTYTINIESAGIGFDTKTVKIYVADENGVFNEDVAYSIDSIDDIYVATKLKFVFGVNTPHVAPFDIRLKNNNSQEIITVVKGSQDGVYIMDLSQLTPGVGMLSTPADSVYTGCDEFIFNFSLLSVAVNASSQRVQESNEGRVKINVNRQIANIKIERTDATSATDWLRGQLTLLISNYNDSDGTEFSYQIGYGIDGALPTEWFDLDLTTFEPAYNATTQYRVYRYILRDHFNGRIYVRALNSAGFVGGTQAVSIDVSYDATIPNVLRAIEMIDQNGNKITAYDVYANGDATDGTVEVGTSGEITIYSSREVRLISQDNDQYAPTLFFGIQSANPPTSVPTVVMGGDNMPYASDLGNWRNLTTPITFEVKDTLDGVVAYMYASNGFNQSDANPIKVTVYIDNRTPSFNVVLPNGDGGPSNAAGESGVWVYAWATSNDIGFSTANIAPDIKVFYQVNIAGRWYDLNETDPTTGNVIGRNGSLQYNYSFNKDTLYALIGRKSIQATVTFRVVTETGAAYEHPTSVKLQVDTEEPSFDLDIISNGVTYTTVNWNGDAWVANIISFRITPTDPDANPSGVIYSYSFGADNVFKTLHNLSFNSNNIAGLTYQRTDLGDIYCGEGRLIIRAEARATGEEVQKEIHIRIDALEPEFDIAASYTKNAVKYPVNSGDWVSVQEVNLELGNIGKKTIGSVTYTNFSKVTVTYELTDNDTESSSGNEPPIYANQSFTIDRKTTIKFKATSESGRYIEKEFVVNIDTKAPVVVSRIQEGQKYYVDERISWLHDEDTIKISTLNGVQFSRGEVVSVETINLNKWTESNPANNGGYGKGYCELYLEDLAGNKVYFYFYMLPSELTVDNITLDDAARLDEYLAAINASCQAYSSGGSTIYPRALTEVRETFFRNHYNNLVQRLSVLESEVGSFQNYLKSIAGRTIGNFTLLNDYLDMKARVEAFNGYATWEQNKILEGSTTVEGEVRTYKTIFNTLIEAYDALNVKMQQVETVRNAVQSLPARMVVVVEDYSDVIKAYDAYMSLSGDQKAVFSSPKFYKSDLRGKLFDVKARCEELMLTDVATGVAIFGDKLAEGKTIRLNVESVSKITDDYINIQKKILSGVDTNNPRAVIAVYKLYLTGENSSNPTGTITITLTIPEEKDSTGTDYRSYTAFAVYKYLADGTLVSMNDVKIAPDGKSVSFEADSLGSYALACNANVVEKSESDTVYGKIGSIVIDGTMIVYIAIGAAVIFGVLIIILIITSVRRRRFLNRYDKRHRYGLAARGISAVPKGNPSRRRNPLNPNEYAHPKVSGTELPKKSNVAQNKTTKK